ncbi:MAG: peptidylprolyl isomerase [Candidatus Omnitrophica bacterium]|nr:peptidylprolyl isomerase [Candidatus Omnitrophota bacterium]MDE2010400.1 peptidylprolyl isomerase [Candidatus Omnitrophota bacterium]MDE2214755.1 peptidylprolyl isomerase [Candidatus Omnitrophota bacterium]MDE2231462.1 peptidylprolyl isomerase [Candidatus Omnitrophota bacterium]
MKKFLAGCVMLVAVGTFSGHVWADTVVGPGKKVTMDYTLTVDNKQVETSVGKAPLVYTVGDHEIIPGLESQLNGMRVNDEKVVHVAAKDAYGEVDPKAFRDFPVSSLPKGLTPKVGMILQATAPDGSKFPAVISAVKGDQMTLNFNHPLAGKDLTFKVKILKIENAPATATTP